MYVASSRRSASRKTRKCIRSFTTPSTERTREQLRQLLRETAQSVAVVTTLLPPEGTNQSVAVPSGNATQSAYHGATLSSFTSIAFDPYPLVAFSLRNPSRMAAALNFHVDRTQADTDTCTTPHMVINILSAVQPDLAVMFSRADLHSRPFQESHVQWTKSGEGFPIISDALGALSCALISPSLPLGDLRWLPGCRSLLPNREEGVELRPIEASGGSTSELFIARVLRVERVPRVEGDKGEDEGLRTLPLLYHRRKYATPSDIPPKS
ncbi:flavin reductase like domain-containing protein [Scleroderma citrinum]